MLLTPIVLDGGCGARSYLRKIADDRMPMLQDQMADLAAGNGLKVSDVIADDYARLKSELPEHDVLSRALLPTPVVNDMGAGKTVDDWDEWTAKTKEKHQNGNGHGPSLNIEMLRLLPPVPEESMIRTPSVTDSTGGARSEKQASERGQMVKTADQMVQLAAENGLKVSPAVAESLDLLGTPRTSSANASTKRQVDAGAPKARIEDQVQLLATPVASEGLKAPAQQTSAEKSQTGQVWLSNQAKDMEQAWGKFEPAIRRWETVLGRPAPAPTKPDGKDGAHRLSSKFTEWMMGVPDGWITDAGLTRNEELKACGNGVVPQQAELALRILLEGIAFEPTRGGQVMFPTPTVSDTFTDNLASTQQKPGSMHSVTLPQAIKMMRNEETTDH